MGTRHIIQVIKDNKTLISQYGQYDGYPEGQGVDVLNFVRNMDSDAFGIKVSNCEYPPASELENATVEDYPTMSRTMSAGILQYIQDSTEPVPLLVDLDFMNDSLFCEWVYVIDLDNDKLEVYEGFNKSPVPKTNRFQLAEGEIPTPSYAGGNTYYPVVLVKEYDFDNLPSDAQFIRECDPPEEDEELFTNEAVLPNVIRALREQGGGTSQEDKLLNSMLNYIEANVDDFLESIED